MILFVLSRSGEDSLCLILSCRFAFKFEAWNEWFSLIYIANISLLYTCLILFDQQVKYTTYECLYIKSFETCIISVIITVFVYLIDE